MRLKSKKYKSHVGKVYDIGVATKDHSYSVNGAIVHNSAGGSLASMFLEIIKVDPMEHDLLFERFMTPERAGLSKNLATFIEICTDEGILKLTMESKISVKRDGEVTEISAKDADEGDEFLFEMYDYNTVFNEIIG